MILWIASIAIIAATSAGAYLWLTNRHALPPAQQASLSDLASVISSEQFARLPDEQKLPYVQRGLSLSPPDAGRMVLLMTPAQREAAFKNISHLLIVQSTNDYFALTTPAARQAYVDHILDWYDAVRQANNRLPNLQMVSQQQQQEAHVKRHDLAGRMLQNLGPSQSARMAEFWKQLIVRGAQRKIFGR